MNLNKAYFWKIDSSFSQPKKKKNLAWLGLYRGVTHSSRERFIGLKTASNEELCCQRTDSWWACLTVAANSDSLMDVKDRHYTGVGLIWTSITHPVQLLLWSPSVVHIISSSKLLKWSGCTSKPCHVTLCDFTLPQHWLVSTQCKWFL